MILGLENYFAVRAVLLGEPQMQILVMTVSGLYISGRMIMTRIPVKLIDLIFVPMHLILFTMRIFGS